MSQKISYIFIWILSMSGLVSAAVNYSEYFPNWSTALQSQSNGWATPVSSSKEIMTPEWCRKITSSQSSQKLIPTRTMNEWVSFRDHIPSGVTINSCLTPINGWWSAWSGLSACSVSCGGGTQSQSRVCNNPAPANGWANCVGSTTQSLSCNTQICPGWLWINIGRFRQHDPVGIAYFQSLPACSAPMWTACTLLGSRCVWLTSPISGMELYSIALAECK